MLKELYVGDGIDTIINQFQNKMLTGVFVIKSVGLSELALLTEAKRFFPRGTYFHITIPSDSDTLARARAYLDDLCSEADIREIILNLQIGIGTNYEYLDRIVKEGAFKKVILSHSDREPDSRKLAEWIVDVRDSVLLDWEQFRFGDVASAVYELEQWQFKTEAKRVEELKGSDYRKYLTKWFQTIKKDIRALQAKTNELEDLMQGGK